MMTEFPAAISRRRLLQATGTGVLAASILPDHGVAAVPGQFPQSRAKAATVRITAAPASVPLMGTGKPETPVLAYDDAVPGPVLRLRQGVQFHATVRNRLQQDTTVHWHGIRLPNDMDGVPGLTQKAIEPGSDFRYAFTPPDAGTFWVHPHDHTAEQMGRGMAGALIVEEPEPPGFDRDLIWVLQDWSFQPDGRFVPGFDTTMEAAMSGRIGSVITINGAASHPVAVRAGERIRLRLINACLARFMALRFAGHRVRVLALDGQPVARPFAPRDGRVLIAPAQRVDLLLDATGVPGERYPVTDDFYGSGATYRLTTLAYSAKPALRNVLPATPILLPLNPVPKPDLSRPVRHRLTLLGGMSGRMAGMAMMADEGDKAIWGIRDSHDKMNNGMTPIFTIPLGRTALIRLENRTTFWHPMHLHGYSFTVLSRNGVAERYPHVRDTVTLRPKDQVEIAFVADNPGDWMFHCHVIEHQSSGLMTTIRVA